MGFIEQIAPLIQKYAPEYGINVCSPVIAQAILESASGTSELAKNAHNYFGLKHRAGRCPSACGIYNKIGSEQNSNGSYISSNMQWVKFATMEAGVQGYFDFINISNYSNLKYVTDPKTYLENIKKDGYATSINYVQNLMNVINKYNLTKYDTISDSNSAMKGSGKMKINIHAGHNPDGKAACGAIGFIKESTEARIVKDKVISMLKSQGHTVYDCTVDNGISQNDVLKKIVSKCNAHSVDLDISIHFNSGASDRKGNGKTAGTEVFVYSSASKAKKYAQNIVNTISHLGFKNRGVKYSTSLYILKNTKSPSLLIECCFVDDIDDIKIYNADKVAQAIVKGITGITSVQTAAPNYSTPPVTNQGKFFFENIDYSLVFDSAYYANKYTDLKKAFGTNSTALFNHFCSNGMKEGRVASANFDVNVYKNNYADLRNAFGNNLPPYYRHYITNGHAEKRKCV